MRVFAGLISRTGVLAFNTNGSQSSARWNSASADVSATIYVKSNLRLVETFQFRDFSVAGNFLDLTNNFFNAASLGSGSLLNPISFFPPTTLSHSSSSPADVINENTVNMTRAELQAERLSGAV